MKNFFLILSLFFSFSYAESASVCKDMLSGPKRFGIKNQGTHDSRLIAEQMDFTAVRHDLMQITGRIPIDCKPGSDVCINDRYTNKNKDLFRKFIVRRLKKLKLNPRIDTFERKAPSYTSSYVGPSSYVSSIVPGEVTDKEAKDLFSSAQLKDLWKYLIKIEEMDDDPRIVQEIADIDKINEIISDIKKKNEKYTEINDVKLNWALIDARNFRTKLENGEKEREKSKDKEEETPDEADDDIEDAVNNIVVTIEGSQWPDEVIEISTHYDSQGRGVAGADDNGSGIVTALEMIRLFQINKPKRTLRFVFTDLEEQDGSGADNHAETIAEIEDEKFIGALVIDMFGYARLGTNPKFVAEIGEARDYDTEAAFKKGVKLGEVLAYQYTKYKDRHFSYDNLFYDSSPNTGDHGAYWDNDLPAIFIAQPVSGSNPANHSSTDTIENMNWGFFEEVAKLITETTSTLTWASLNSSKIDSDRVKYLDIALDPSVKKVKKLDIKEKPPVSTYKSPNPVGGGINQQHNRPPMGGYKPPSGAGYNSRPHSPSGAGYVRPNDSTSNWQSRPGSDKPKTETSTTVTPSQLKERTVGFDLSKKEEPKPSEEKKDKDSKKKKDSDSKEEKSKDTPSKKKEEDKSGGFIKGVLKTFGLDF